MKKYLFILFLLSCFLIQNKNIQEKSIVKEKRIKTMFLINNKKIKLDNLFILKDKTKISTDTFNLFLFRTSDKEIEARVFLPLLDTNKKNILDLSELIIAIAPEKEKDKNPFDGINTENIISYAERNKGQSSTLFLTKKDIGFFKASRFNELEVENIYWVICSLKYEI